MNTPPPLLFCFGLGYSALAFARALQESGWQVAGSCRSPEKQAALARLGIAAELIDRTRPLGVPAPLIARLEEGPVNALVVAPPTTFAA